MPVPSPGSTTLLHTFKLDDAFESLFPDTGWRMPSASEAEAYENRPECWTNGVEVKLAGDLIHAGDVEFGSPVGTIVPELRPHPNVLAQTRLYDNGVHFQINVHDAGMVEYSNYGNPAVADGSDGLVYCRFEIRYVLASAVAPAAA